MSDFKKYQIVGDCDCQEEAYYKGQQTWDHNKYPDSYNTLIRITPSPKDEGWSIPTGVEGKTLGTLKDYGNGVIINLGGSDIRLGYDQYNYLQNLMRIERMNQKWPLDKITESVWEPDDGVVDHYECGEDE
jgi:hypothetical protein